MIAILVQTTEGGVEKHVSLMNTLTRIIVMFVDPLNAADLASDN